MHQDKLGVIIITNILYKMKWKHKAPPPPVQKSDGCSKLFWMLSNFLWQEIGIKKSFSQASWNATYEILSIGLYLNI